MLDNMNTPMAISKLHSLVDDINKDNSFDNYKANVLLYTARALFGVLCHADWQVWFQGNVSRSMLALINDLIRQRDLAKANGDYEKADKIRRELLSRNIVLEDSVDETYWRIL
jgi:cysteinyl-tRNA synthetase